MNRLRIAWLMLSYLSLTLNGLAQVSSVPQDKKDLTIPTTPLVEDDALTGLLNLEFSNYHLTGRGLNLLDEGLVSQPKLVLDWRLYQNKSAEADINRLSIYGGVWNDVDSKEGGVRPGNWNEIDPSFGYKITLFHKWDFDSPFTAYVSETHSYPVCWNYAPTLTYRDQLFPSFSINPYVEYYRELTNKSTVVFNTPTSKSSYYGVVGFDPTYKFATLPLILELPSYLTIPGAHFYQRADGSPGGTDIGLATTMIKATIPLDVISPQYGKWSVYGGVQYEYLNNPGLLDGNRLLALNNQRDFVTFHGGITIRF